MGQRVELASGLLAGGLGLVGIAVWTSVAEDVGLVAAVVLVVVPGLLALGIAIGAYLDGRRGLSTGRWLLWGSTGLLWVAALLLSAMRGLLLPAAVVALVAVVASSRRRQGGALAR